MTAEEALRLWAQLIGASPHGCRVHLTGGEPFGRWSLLLEVCEGAAKRGLAPLKNVETNGYWATDETVIRDRLGALDAAGMETLAISADPYHQQFVPIDRARRLARVAEYLLGSQRVQVRWRDWLTDGVDTSDLAESERVALFASYARQGRDRMNGRAAAALAPHAPLTPLADLPDRPCREPLLRGKHIHALPGGHLMPGTCAGIVVGRADESTTVADCWSQLGSDHAASPLLGALIAEGPKALLPMARDAGFAPAAAYAGKCHLCWSIRAHLVSSGPCRDELAPASVYGPSRSDGP